MEVIYLLRWKHDETLRKKADGEPYIYFLTRESAEEAIAKMFVPSSLEVVEFKESGR